VSLMLVMSLALGCVDKVGGVDRIAVLEALADEVASGHYRDFEARAGLLSEATAALCAAPDEAALEAARDAWWSAKAPWQRAEIIHFGPTEEYPERLGPKLDDWPVNAEAVEALVAGEGGLTPGDFEEMGTATRGLPVVEYLLWEAPDSLLGEARRCEVAAGAAADVAGNAALLAEVWDRDWAPALSGSEEATGALYATPQAVIDEWANRMVYTVENIRAEKLGKPLGDSAGGEPQPDALESRPSGRSLTDARDALAGVGDVWSGVDRPGMIGLVEDAELSARIDALLAAALAALAAVPETLEHTIQGDTASAVAAQEALQALQVGLQVELAQALGVTVAFNDNDGD